MRHLARSVTKSRQSVAPLLFIFIDGVGIGRPDPGANPLFAGSSQILGFYQGVRPQTYRDSRMIPTDATLGVGGRPQSATGQTALFTGLNAPSIVGRHLNGFPSPALKELLRNSIFRKAKDHGLTVSFANAFRPEYFSEPAQRVSATTAAFQHAEIPFRSFDDLRKGNAVSHEFTRTLIGSRGHHFESIEPEEAARHLLTIFLQCDLLLYEFFLTDVVAHTQSMPDALDLLGKLERFLQVVIDGLNLEDEGLVMTSDHGNFEDFSTRSHTLNPVATQVWGRAMGFFPSEATKGNAEGGVRKAEGEKRKAKSGRRKAEGGAIGEEGKSSLHSAFRTPHSAFESFSLTDVGPCILKALGAPR